MKQLYKLMAILLCSVLIVACGGETAVSNQTINGGSPIHGNESRKEENLTPADADSFANQEQSPLARAKADNPDTVAWLRVSGTNIDAPVMQTSNNEDYLKRNENGDYDAWGCYFADYYANLTAVEKLVPNTVIYGHSDSTENPDGKRFSQLFRYLDLDFLKENPNIYLTVGAEELTFQIFAVFFTDTDFYYIDPSPSDQGFEQFIKEVNAKNEYVFPDSSLTEQDRLLTLSACAYRYDTDKTGDHRLVVMARLVKDDAQVQGVTANPDPQRP